MLYRKFGKTGLYVSALGFGCMRLPLANPSARFLVDDGEIDEEKATAMLHAAIDAGVNYVDTAYPYHQGNSESFVGRALAGDWRDKVYLATKLPSWLVQSRADMDRYLDEQLKKLRTDHIDFYLVHTINKVFWPNLVKNGVFEFLAAAMDDGRIGYAGFSFHDELGLFKEVVDAYDWSFCQIMYNYMDVNYQAGTAGLDYAASRGLGVAVMEPLRGGRLAAVVPPAAQAVWDRAAVKRSPAEWALRFVWDDPRVSVVLSGMSEPEQVAENVRIAGQAAAGSLSAEERALIAEVRGIYESRIKVNCTGCRYCMPCPSGVDIPGCFTLFNNAHIFEDVFTNRLFYSIHMEESRKAASCTECGRCEEHCPQHVPIRAMLKETAKLFA